MDRLFRERPPRQAAHPIAGLVDGQARQLLRPGDTVLVESPTFPGALDAFRRFGARPVPVPLDEDGMRVDLLEDLIERSDPRLLYVAPHFHNPTGTVLTAERRATIAALAAANRLPVLEDLAMADVVLCETYLANSSGGTIVTNGNPEGEERNSLFGVDAVWRTSTFRGNKNFLVGGWTAATSRADPTTGPSSRNSTRPSTPANCASPKSSSDCAVIWTNSCRICRAWSPVSPTGCNGV